MGSDFRHVSVLLQQAIDHLEIKKGLWYVDATAGGGGHAQEILNRGGMVLAIDQDADAISHLEEKFKDEKHIKIIKSNFTEIKEICQSESIRPAGILFDLGLSSYQIEGSGRGFSFQRDEDLDMRMNKQGTLSAYAIVNEYGREALYEIFSKYGEEPYAEQIAQAILNFRRTKPIRTTADLVGIIKSVSGEGRIHPATRVFQALRIVVNNEMQSLENALIDAFEVLSSGGSIAVISFHSLEDRIVKRFMEKYVETNKGSIVVKKPILADFAETKKNTRARSAKMRVIEKI